MKYEEIKRRLENPQELSQEELREMYDSIRELIYDAERGIKNGLEVFLEEIKIYDKYEIGIPLHSEPREIKRKIRNLIK